MRSKMEKVVGIGLPVMIACVLSTAMSLLPATGADVSKPQDCPMFGGTPDRNLINTVAKNIPVEWSVQEGQRKNIKFSAALGSISYGGPIIADGKIFVGTNNEKPRNPKIKGDKGVVMCFRESDGAFLWQAVHDKLESGMENDWPQQGVASSPVVEGKRVYYVNNRCEVICADTEGFLDGKNDGVQDEKYTEKTDADIIWRLDMVKEMNVYPRFLANCSPLIAGDLLFVVTGNGVNEENKVISPDAPSFLAIDKATGKVAWKSNAPGVNILDGQWGNPAYAEVKGKGQIIFPGGDGWLYGFDAKNGGQIWKFDCNPKNSEYKPGGRGTRNYILSTPVVHDNKAFIGVGQNPDHGTAVGHFWCVDITKTGDLSPVKDNFDPKADVNKDSGLVWHYGGKIEPRPASGRDVIFGRTLSTAAIFDDILYITELEGEIHCLNAKTGARLWMEDLKAEIWGSPYYVDGKIYLGTNDGDIHIYRHGKERKYVGKVAMDSSLKSTPVVANGVLYVLTDTQLFAIAPK